MQSRMSNPVMILPDAMKALRALEPVRRMRGCSPWLRGVTRRTSATPNAPHWR